MDLDDLAAMDETVDDGGDTGRRREDLVPLGKRLVGGDEDRLVLVSSGDHLVEEVGMTGVVGQVSELVDDEDLGPGECSATITRVRQRQLHLCTEKELDVTDSSTVTPWESYRVTIRLEAVKPANG